MFLFVDLSIFAGDKRAVDFEDPRQKWAYYIKNIGNMKESDVKGETGIFLEFINECRMSNLNETEMKEYEKSIMEYADVQDACVAAKEDGYAEGGVNKAKEIALGMLTKGYSVDIISDLTGLTEDEIQKLTPLK
jgi:predicted transposase/invertase (TIGR01784 family)